ncbi:MAG: DeoR/GlpR family DNA-binding transcription regulator [Ardenticatenaceae bacterium]|nr:DeoR/GlpR family DNA-binding transcription regulator [Ardenticatenaceae bacterium]
MPRRLFPEERWKCITGLIEQHGRVSVNELSDLFDVSKVTVRGDLDELERRGLLQRTHGGAIASDGDKAELTFKDRELINLDDKSRIGEAAAALVNHGDTIALDASTTALQVAKQIKNRHELTVVTNSIYIALELEDASDVTVVVPGGIMRRGTLSLVGQLGEEGLTKFNIQKGFFGAKGITLNEGLTDVNAFEVQLKRIMVRMAKQVIAIVDHSKWGRVAFASFASVDQLDMVITDAKAPEELVGKLRERGVEIVLA